jgi:hypothetical protein
VDFSLLMFFRTFLTAWRRDMMARCDGGMHMALQPYTVPSGIDKKL